MTTPEALGQAVEAVFAEQRRCRDNPARVGGLEYALTAFAPTFALLEQRLAELEKERDHYRFHFDQEQQRAEAAESRLAAYERVVEAARLAYDGFGEDDHKFYGSQKRLVDALAALKEQAQ